MTTVAESGESATADGGWAAAAAAEAEEEVERESRRREAAERWWRWRQRRRQRSGGFGSGLGGTSCPNCSSEAGRALSACVPFSHQPQTRLVCRISGNLMNDVSGRRQRWWSSSS